LAKEKPKGPVLRKFDECESKGTQYWLMKSEPNDYSLADLKKDKTALWDGVRNYQARNIMRDRMKIGDEVLFYHSNADPAGVVGLATVHKKAVPDVEAFNKKSKYFDPKSKKDDPTWFCVEVKYKSTFDRTVSLEEMKTAKPLANMLVIQRGQRLSIQPVSKGEFGAVCKLAKK
jgi:predicted RNA-binding protein with PUA-like domain